MQFDPNLIRRVIENFFVNAVQHTRSDGRIEIRVRKTGSRWLELSVIDDGEGIDPAYHQAVFEKFGQAAAPQGRSKSGSGLGLTFCKMAVEAHGGRIGVRSKPGQGAAFYFRLPLESGRRS